MNRFAVPILTALFLAIRATADRPAIGQPEASLARSLTAVHVETVVKNSVKLEAGDASHPGTAVFYNTVKVEVDVATAGDISAGKKVRTEAREMENVWVVPWVNDPQKYQSLGHYVVLDGRSGDILVDHARGVTGTPAARPDGQIVPPTCVAMSDTQSNRAAARLPAEGVKAAGSATLPHADAFRIQCRKPADHVAVTVGADTTSFTVTSPSGIGSASIERTGPAWPASVILRLDLKGLEGIETMKLGNKKRRIGV
jgi:hypothetical protein